jgi:GalNAc-alpha-(1->4)-GalNAc-alpha-(1->3)-diNAcBac-PP-undecaprenol alpha-1,4-N-acetyl-D-galactosaminyltransferase
MTTPKRIALIIHSLQFGGMERVMTELANEFVRRGHEVHVVLFGIHRDVAYQLDAAIILHRPDFPFNDRQRILSALRTMLFLRRKLQNIRPWAALSFGLYWNNYVLLSLLGSGIPLFISDRSQPDKKLSRSQELLRRWLYPRAAGIIAQTRYASEFLARITRHPRIRIIGNPIRCVPGQRGEKRGKIVLTVGRLISTKHHDLLIKMFLRVAPAGWKLVVVGDDAQKQQNRLKLEALILKHNAHDRVELTGARKDVDDFYRRASIFAFTSSSEGFPNVIGEAQSAGLPVIAFDCIAGPSELIQDGVNGYLVPLFDEYAFEKRLLNLIEQPDSRLQLGQAARISVQAFSVPAITERFLAFFEDTIRDSEPC